MDVGEVLESALGQVVAGDRVDRERHLLEPLGPSGGRYDDVVAGGRPGVAGRIGRRRRVGGAAVRDRGTRLLSGIHVCLREGGAGEREGAGGDKHGCDRTVHCAYPDGAGLPPAHSSVMVLVSVPMLPIETSTVSPAFIHKGGVRLPPTPPGVPVAITSPDDRAVKVET